MPKTGDTQPRCPICDRPIDPAIAPFQRKLDAHIERILRADHPGWHPDDGVCPDCVYRAAQRAQAERSSYSLHEELLAPFPVYLRDQLDVLPTPGRVHANPKYAGRGVTIAFLDSGFYPHPDLVRPANRILCHVDATTGEFVEGRGFKRLHVSSWHGLMTSCVGAGSGFMSDGRHRGIAHRANVVLVKTGNPRGGHRLRITERDIQRALNWVIANQRRFNIGVVNISVGGDHPSTGEMTSLDAKIEDAVAHGMVVVAAIGNRDARRVVPPASAPSAISVGGLDDQNSLDPRLRRMYWSSYGKGVGGVSKPDVIAPALWLAAPMLPGTSIHNEAQFLWRMLRAPDAEFRRILETDYAQARFSKKTLNLPLAEIRDAIRRRMIEQKVIHPHYQHVDGTSMAAPIVSAIAAQMLEADSALTPAQVKQRLIETAEPLPGVPPERQGHGVINGGRAVASVLRASRRDGAAPPFAPQRTVTFHYYDSGARQVALVGSFTDWQPVAMRERSPGIWFLTLPQPARGTHPYKYVVDGARWLHDPENLARIEDGYGGFYSLLEIV